MPEKQSFLEQEDQPQVVAADPPRKEANVQKRDTTFKQEHGAVTHLLKRKPEQAVARAVKGAQKLLAEDNPKQALNVLTLTKGAHQQSPATDVADYYLVLGQLQVVLGNNEAAQVAFEQAEQICGK